MKLDGQPASLFGRSHDWSDDLPRWFNRLAHFICLYLVGTGLGVPLVMWLRDKPFDRALEWMEIAGVNGAVVYACALAFCEVRRRWTSRRQSASGA
jgi:hypothetical protein